MQNEFQCKIPGKWILLGEHSVVRGAPALAFPLHSKQLHMHARLEKIAANFTITASDEKSLLLVDAFKRAMESHPLYQKLPSVRVLLRLESSIPTSSGQGSSAAICTGAAMLLKELGLVSDKEIFSASHTMENHFHGSSSGLDIAAVQSTGGIFFQKNHAPVALHIINMPKFYLFDTGARSATKEAVEKVQAMARADIDERMSLAVRMARKSLEETRSLPELVEAVRMGRSCFEEWGLINPAMKEGEEKLLAAGALAVKPTGSGNGGFLLSVWNKSPPEKLPLLPCF